MSDAQDEPHGRRSWWGIAFVSVVLSYALSAGPVIYGMIFLQKRVVDTNAIKVPVLVLYFPHLIVARHAEWYYGYLTWCAESAGGRGQSYERFKRDFIYCRPAARNDRSHRPGRRCPARRRR